MPGQQDFGEIMWKWKQLHIMHPTARTSAGIALEIPEIKRGYIFWSIDILFFHYFGMIWKNVFDLLTILEFGKCVYSKSCRFYYRNPYQTPKWTKNQNIFFWELENFGYQNRFLRFPEWFRHSSRRVHYVKLLPSPLFSQALKESRLTNPLTYITS